MLQASRALSVARPAFRRALSLARAASPVLLLGCPELREVCAPCGASDLSAEKSELVATLEDFRSKNGFGRGIAAPQIGITRRFIALNLGDGPQVLSDPLITWHSDEKMTLWDDCMSLPWLLCRVSRSCSISLTFKDEQNNQQHWEKIDPAVSELLQHEIDHLDGVLITDRANELMNAKIAYGSGTTSTDFIISREVYERDKDQFDDQVDYYIKPTLP